MAEMSKEYGTALFMLACEEGKTEEYCSSLDIVANVLSENEEYVTFLTSPNIPVAERVAAIEQAFADFVPEHIVSFLQLLCERSRIGGFSECVKEYKILLDASKHTSVAKVTSSVPLTKEETVRLKEKLEKISGNSVILDCRTDESLIGGIVVEIDGKVIDGSLRRRLHEVKEVMFK